MSDKRASASLTVNYNEFEECKASTFATTKSENESNGTWKRCTRNTTFSLFLVYTAAQRAEWQAQSKSSPRIYLSRSQEVTYIATEKFTGVVPQDEKPVFAAGNTFGMGSGYYTDEETTDDYVQYQSGHGCPASPTTSFEHITWIVGNAKHGTRHIRYNINGNAYTYPISVTATQTVLEFDDEGEPSLTLLIKGVAYYAILLGFDMASSGTVTADVPSCPREDEDEEEDEYEDDPDDPEYRDPDDPDPDDEDTSTPELIVEDKGDYILVILRGCRGGAIKNITEKNLNTGAGFHEAKGMHPFQLDLDTVDAFTQTSEQLVDKGTKPEGTIVVSRTSITKKTDLVVTRKAPTSISKIWTIPHNCVNTLPEFLWSQTIMGSDGPMEIPSYNCSKHSPQETIFVVTCGDDVVGTVEVSSVCTGFTTIPPCSGGGGAGFALAGYRVRVVDGVTRDSIAGATVDITGVGTSQTDSTGNVRVTMPAGTYEMTVSKDNYAPVVKTITV